ISVADIGGANLMVVFFNVIGNNLRHSHVWISYGPVIEHVFSSPAQHQIHHSRAQEHHNKNYGEIFSLWDWMFGTLYIPQGREEIAFGLGDADGRPIAQPHDNLRNALVLPLKESLAALRGSFKPQADPGIRPESRT
ncbi:MAG: sterol desaturase family protein, partial [Rhizobiaceae bacterium]